MTIGMANFQTEGTQTPPRLAIAEDLAEKVTLVAGIGALSQGSLLGRVSATNQWRLSVATSTDGSQTPRAILAEAVTVGATTLEAMVYYRGQFIEQSVVFGTGHTAASTRDILRDAGIYLIRASY